MSENSEITYWQIAAGSGGRDYAAGAGASLYCTGTDGIHDPPLQAPPAPDGVESAASRPIRAMPIAENRTAAARPVDGAETVAAPPPAVGIGARMIPPNWTDEERAAFWEGFSLARPPGDAERDALGHISRKVGPSGGGGLRIAVPKDAAVAVVDATEGLPENLSSATWVGFVRGMVAKAGGEAVGSRALGLF